MQTLEIDKLVFNENIVTTPTLIINYYAYTKGEPVLCVNTKQPFGKVYFFTDDISLECFYNNKISLLKLFLKSTSRFITLVINNEIKYFIKPDIEIELEQQEKYLKDLILLSKRN